MIEPKNIKYGYEKLLTKSMFLKGVQCSKLFWHYCNEKKLFEDESITSQAFDQGKMAGDYAKKLFANGIEIDWNNGFDNGLHNSAESLKLDKPLFEPGFIFNQLFCRNDILLPVSKNRKTEKSHKADKSGDYVFDIIEVKSSTNVNEIHIFDIAFQKYCCEGAGLKIRKCFVMHINNKYERSGELDLDALFIKKDVTKEVDEIQQATEKLIIELLDMLIQKNAPKIKTGEQCFAPYQCPLFSEVCNEYAGTDYSIFQLRKSKKKAQEFANQGILELADIPDSVKLNKTHKIQVMTARSGKPHIDGKAISKFLKQLEYPLYILDFETFSTAVPLFDKLKPYMQVTFQYSLHIVNKLDKDPAHFEYLASGDGDPRIEILDSLYEHIGNTGSILAYNMSFEKARLKENAAAYPKYKNWVNSILPRFVDLLVPFRSFYYYHPQQKGSASVKAVLPALTGLSYSNMAISNGGLASSEYMRIAFTEVDENDKNSVRKNLLDYCKLDTEGLIFILRELEKLILF